MTDAASQVDIFGKLFHPTWTRLAAPVRPGDDRAYLQQVRNHTRKFFYNVVLSKRTRATRE